MWWANETGKIPKAIKAAETYRYQSIIVHSHTHTDTYLCTCAFAAIVIPFLCLCRRCNNYGTTPTLQAAARGAVNGNNNIPPATPTSQIFCLHGRSNNVEVDGKFTSSRWWRSVKSGRGRRPVVSGAGVGGVDKLRHFPCRFQSAPSNLQSFINYQENAAAACIFAGKKSKQTTKLVFTAFFVKFYYRKTHTHT